MKRSAPLGRTSSLTRGPKSLANYRKHGSTLAPMSKRPARRAELKADAEWRAAIRAVWGDGCLLCGRPGEIAHLLSKGAHPKERTEEWNGLPLCAEHHRTGRYAPHSSGPLAGAMAEFWREITGVLKAVAAGKRPRPSRTEIFHDWQVRVAELEGRHVSPIGRSD